MGNLKLTCLAGLMSIAMCGHAQITPVSQMENLGRGVVALPSSKTGILVSWRMLGTEDENRMTFDVLRDGEVVASDLAYVTNYADTKGKSTPTCRFVFSHSPMEGVPASPSRWMVNNSVSNSFSACK